MSLTGEDLLFAGVVALLAVALWIVKHFSNPPLALLHWAEEQGCLILRAMIRPALACASAFTPP